MRNFDFPPRRAAVSALFLAPLPPAVILFALDAIDRAIQFGPTAIAGALLLSVYVAIVMELFAVIVGGLILAAVWRKIPFRLHIFSLLGGLVAIIPVMALVLLNDGGNYDAWSDGRPTVVDGHKTALGYWEDLQTLMLVFAFGAIGGASFWWLCRPKQMTDTTTQ